MSARGTTASPLPRGGRAVMERRKLPTDSLDYFPTPPWATRALLEHVIHDIFVGASGADMAPAPVGAGQPKAPLTCWEPACGGGHMVNVLTERFRTVYASDVHDYGGRQWVGSFVGHGPDVIHERFSDPIDWIITNPPFNLAVEFAERALGVATAGVALLVRMSWLEGGDRYRRLFERTPPAVVAPFVERVPMVAGRWDPDASTATAYAWFVWKRLEGPLATETRLVWIPPGCRERLTRSDDRRRFAPETMPPGFL